MGERTRCGGARQGRIGRKWQRRVGRRGDMGRVRWERKMECN